MARPPSLNRLVTLTDVNGSYDLVREEHPLNAFVAAVNDRFGVVCRNLGVVVAVDVRIQRNPLPTGSVTTFPVESHGKRLFEMHTLIITDGLLAKASAREIAAVVAHEIAHLAIDAARPIPPTVSRRQQRVPLPRSVAWSDEYRADAAAAVLFGAAATETILRRAHAETGNPTWWKNLSHPPLAWRLHHLRRKTFFREWKYLLPKHGPQ